MAWWWRCTAGHFRSRRPTTSTISGRRRFSSRWGRRRPGAARSQQRKRRWTPLKLAARIDDRGGRSLRVFARLRPGVSIGQAQAAMDTVASRLAAAYPRTNAKLGISVLSLHEKVVGPIRRMLFVLLGTVAF